MIGSRRWCLFILCCFISLFLHAQVYSDSAGFFDDVWTRNDLKFIMIYVGSVFVAVLSLYSDARQSLPRKVDVGLTVALTTIMVILCYEWAIHSGTQMIWAMILAFAVGTFSFQIFNYLKKTFEPIMKQLVDMVLAKIKKIFNA